MALPFWISIAVLSTVQGAVVGLVTLPPRMRALAVLRHRGWALIPPASVILFVVLVRLAGGGTQVLTYLALVAVPPLAAAALALFLPRARPAYALAAPALFALAWADRGGLAGEAAALVLTALACVTLGALIAAVTPYRALAAGIVAMALADTALVVSDLLQRPNSALNAARPAADLPRLQAAVFGSAVMGFGDLFVAAALGGLLAAVASRRTSIAGALLTGAIALAFDLLFFAVDELPATVPVALALVALTAVGRIRARRARRAGAAARPETAPLRAGHGGPSVRGRGERARPAGRL